MRTPLLLAATAIALLVAAPAVAQMLTITPEQIGQVFCISRLGNDTAPIEGLLTSELKSTIAEAESKNDAIQQQAPEEKPPLGDGIPWQAWPDYADQCSVGATTLMQDEARVVINYAFKDHPDANFTDSLLLKLVPGPYDNKLWRIDDVAYATEGSLRSALVNAFLLN